MAKHGVISFLLLLVLISGIVGTPECKGGRISYVRYKDDTTCISLVGTATEYNTTDLSFREPLTQAYYNEVPIMIYSDTCRFGFEDLHEFVIIQRDGDL